MLSAPTKWMAEKRMKVLTEEEPDAHFRVESRLGSWVVVRSKVEAGIPADYEGLSFAPDASDVPF